MLAPDLDSAMTSLQDMIRRGESHPAVHRGRHLDRMRHPRFPLAGRDLDQEPADPVRRVPGEPGGAQRILAAPLRHGRRSSAKPGRDADIGRWRASTAPARCRRWSRRTSTTCIKPLASHRNTSSSCTAIRPTLYASIASSATNCRGCASAWRRATAARRIVRRCGGFIKTATISFGQAMPDAAMRRAQDLTLSCDLFLAIGSSLVVWPAAGFPLDGQAQRRPLVIINREPTEFDDIADLVVREDIGTVLEPFISPSVIHRCSQAVTLLAVCCIFVLFPLDGGCYLRFKRFVVSARAGRQHKKRRPRRHGVGRN